MLDRLQIEEQLKKTAGLGEWAGLAVLAMMTVTGLSLRGGWGKRVQAWCDRPVELSGVQLGRFDRVVSDAWVGVTGIVGLIALSIVACYAYYPSPYECFEEIKAVKAEALHGAMAGDVEKALYWMEQWDDWSRKLEVGAVIRRFELRPYQRMQGFLLRKKLELLEHELEHEVLDLPEIEKLRNELFATSQRLREAYESSE